MTPTKAPSPAPELTLAIVCYNSGQTICDCLAKVIDSDRYDVQIVDNASTDNSVHLLTQRFPGIRIVSNWVNEGYGRAANQTLTIRRKSGYSATLRGAERDNR